ncbi:MAG: DUF3301 domain-containing protein [Oceanospirillaceae bacterium]|nr:DUF3301 domain-containing protein [Oceanospirillaceae bacterium]
MYFEMLDLFMLTIICLIVYYWVSAQKIRELALKAAREECLKLDLQLLDGSVSLKKLKLKRADSGHLALLRVYNFEFSATGAERYSGNITMFGLKVEQVHLQPHRIV